MLLFSRPSTAQNGGSFADAFSVGCDGAVGATTSVTGGWQARATNFFTRNAGMRVLLLLSGTTAEQCAHHDHIKLAHRYTTGATRTTYALCRHTPAAQQPALNPATWTCPTACRVTAPARTPQQQQQQHHVVAPVLALIADRHAKRCCSLAATPVAMLMSTRWRVCAAAYAGPAFAVAQRAAPDNLAGDARRGLSRCATGSSPMYTPTNAQPAWCLQATRDK
jgi:hypothetical protein